MFPEPLCPRCGAALPIRKVWNRYAYRGLRLMQTTGVRCPACGDRLVILQAGAVIANLVILFAYLVVMALAYIAVHAILHRELNDTAVMLLILISVPLPMLVQSRFVPRFCRIRPAEPGEVVLFPPEKDGI